MTNPPDTSTDAAHLPVAHTPTCRSCGSSRLRPFLSLGKTPIANSLLTQEGVAAARRGEEPYFPLDVAFCMDCTLVQILEELPAEVIFDADYPYFSSFSPAMVEHCRRHAVGLVEDRNLGGDSFVVELASNDGYLLRSFVERGVPVLGVDPARDQAAAANADGIPTLCDFFGTDLAHTIRAERGPADVIIANNVMAHVPGLNDFVAGMAVLLADDGLITVENPYVRELVRNCEFDTIYHEHFCYFSCTAVDNLMRRHGLYLNHVEAFPDLHGGSLRWHIGKVDDVSETARAYLREEQESGLVHEAYYAGFARWVEQNREGLLDLLRTLKADGARIAAYGAAAKGSTLANYVGLTPDLIDFVVDRNTHKHGLFLPGTHQPIRPVEALLEEQPDYVLLFAWNFAQEIVAQQDEYLRRGGRFIRPVPVPHVMDGSSAALGG